MWKRNGRENLTALSFKWKSSTRTISSDCSQNLNSATHWEIMKAYWCQLSGSYPSCFDNPDLEILFLSCKQQSVLKRQCLSSYLSLQQNITERFFARSPAVRYKVISAVSVFAHTSYGTVFVLPFPTPYRVWSIFTARYRWKDTQKRRRELTDPIIDSYPARKDFIILLFKTSSLTFCWVVVVVTTSAIGQQDR